MPPFTLRWGLIGTGEISDAFAADLLTDPGTRDVNDIGHRITVIGSRTKKTADAFLEELQVRKLPHRAHLDPSWGIKQGLLEGCKTVGSYDAVFQDSTVDAVYIAGPHNYHFANVKAALLAHKHVLCEKPFCVTLAELEELVALAKQQKVFMMEAVWTRFLPVTRMIEDIAYSGELGKVQYLRAELLGDSKPDTLPDDHRMISAKLAGGALLDLGPYPSVWAMLLLHRNPANKDGKPTLIHSYIDKYARTGVDLTSHWVVKWDGLAHGSMEASISRNGMKEFATVLACEKADLVIESPSYAPETFHVVPRGKGDKKTYHSRVPVGGGWQYQADEVARCVRDGKTESEKMPLAESLIVQGWFDEVLKRG